MAPPQPPSYEDEALARRLQEQWLSEDSSARQGEGVGVGGSAEVTKLERDIPDLIFCRIAALFFFGGGEACSPRSCSNFDALISLPTRWVSSLEIHIREG